MALVFLGAAYQDSDKNKAAEYLRKAIETTTEVPTIALQGLLNCCDSSEVPEICEKLLKLTPEKYEDLHKKIMDVAQSSLAIKCVHALKNEVELPETDENLKRITSANLALAKIYFNNADSLNGDDLLPLVGWINLIRFI